MGFLLVVFALFFTEDRIIFSGEIYTKVDRKTGYVYSYYHHLSPTFFSLIINQGNSEPVFKEKAPLAAPSLPLMVVLAEENKCTFRGNNHLKLINYFNLKGYEIYQCFLVREKLHSSW